MLFTVSSFLSGIAPNLEFLVLMRILQGLGGGPVIPMSQAIMWEIFPLDQRGLAMAVWGVGIMMGPILGPTRGRLDRRQLVVALDLLHQPADRRSSASFMASAFLFDSAVPAEAGPRRRGPASS